MPCRSSFICRYLQSLGDRSHFYISILNGPFITVYRVKWHSKPEECFSLEGSLIHVIIVANQQKRESLSDKYTSRQPSCSMFVFCHIMLSSSSETTCTATVCQKSLTVATWLLITQEFQLPHRLLERVSPQAVSERSNM